MVGDKIHSYNKNFSNVRVHLLLILYLLKGLDMIQISVHFSIPRHLRVFSVEFGTTPTPIPRSIGTKDLST